MAEVNWEEIYGKLPTSKDEREARFEMFDSFDPNGNGILSLAEVDKAMRDVLAIDEIFDAKPAMMRAFQAAKNRSGRDKEEIQSDYIEKLEFKYFLICLKQYFEYFVAFKRIDDDDDRRVSIDEFKEAQADIEKWVGEIGDVEGEFDKIDSNDGGLILFDEFCKWAMAKSLDLEDPDSADE